MSHEAHIHQAQTLILRELLFVPHAGFAALQKPTGLTSDHFKFHIRRLTELGYVAKNSDGNYHLTTSGKEYANKLDTDKNTIERQPKSAVILVAQKQQSNRELILLQERRKHPYFGFWGFPSGKIRWGETILQAAARELHEETGLRGSFTHCSVYHEHAVESESGTLLEDKIFHIILCTNTTGHLKPTFDSGNNAWMTLAEAQSKQKRYASFELEAQMAYGDKPFIEATQYYSKEQF